MNKEEQKRLQGTVVSNNMDKAVTVMIERIKTHRLYKKQFTISKKLKASDPDNSCHIGDLVEMVPTRPISKDIHYKIVKNK